MNKRKWWNLAGILLWTAAVAMLVVSVFLSFSNDIWYDEMFTMGLISKPYRELINIAARDVHPPLYYCIVKLAVDITTVAFPGADAVIIAKLVSVLPFLFLLLLSLTGIRRNFGMLSGGLFAFLILSMPNLPDYTVEIRMYGWSMLFLTWGMVCAYELLNGKAKGKEQTRKQQYIKWGEITLCAMAACYTHYFACVAAVMIYGYLFVTILFNQKQNREQNKKGRWYPFVISGFLCVLCYLPWAGAVFSQVSQVSESYWILPLSWRTLGGCLKFIFKPAGANGLFGILLAVLLFGSFAVVCFRRMLKRDRLSGFILGCLMMLGGLVCFGFVLSFLLRPIFVYRYMLPALGVFWLAFAVAFGDTQSELCKSNRIRLACDTVILLLYLICGVVSYRAFYGEEMWKRVQMQQTRQGLEVIQPGDKLVFNFNHTQGVVGYYLSNDCYLYESTPEELLVVMYPNLLDLEDDNGAEPINTIREWLAQGETVWFLGSGNARDEVTASWLKNGIITQEQGSYLVERYWFNLYAVHD